MQTRMKMILQPFSAAALLLLWVSAAQGYEQLDVAIEKEDGVYRVFGKSRIEAPAEFVHATLMDYDHFYKLAGGIAETRFIPDDESGLRAAYTRYESCVLFFCKTVEKVEYILTNTPEYIELRVDPARSDFISNESSWTIEKDGDATILTFEAEFDPDFWIPPMIDTWAIRRKLERSAETVGVNIEWMQARGLTLAQVAKE